MIHPRTRLLAVLADPTATVPDAFADPEAEAQSLAQGAGVFARASRRTWAVRGADHVDYLHRMLTQDLLALDVACGTRACLLNRNGRVLGDFFVWRFEDRCVLDAEPPAADAALPVLEKFVIADDVEFEEATQATARLVLAGPQAADVLAQAGVPAPAHGAIATAGEVHLLAVPHGPDVRFEVAAPREALEPWLDAVLEDGRTQIVGAAAFERDRLRVREPRQPEELNDAVLFNETLLESAVSWNKGCYPGQEPVIMARHRGKPPRVLVGLAGEGAAPSPDTPVSSDGREVGVVTSAATLPAGAWIGLGYVRQAVVAGEGELSHPGGRISLRS